MAIDPVIMIGSSGHARSVSDVLNAQGCYRIMGLIDSFAPKGESRFGCEILGSESDTAAVCDRCGTSKVVIAIGDNFQREAMAIRLCNEIPELEFVSVVHPSAIVGSGAEVGPGSVIMPRVVVGAGCRIGRGCILNTGCSIDHDGVMEPWSSLAPGAVAGGNVRVGRRSSVGLGAKLIHKVKVEHDTVVGAGALVLSDLPARVVAYGSPCRVVRSRQPDERYL